MEQGISKPHACAKCGGNHSCICPEGSTSYFKCGQTGNFMRYSLKNKQRNANGGNRAQSSSNAPPAIESPRRATFITNGGENCLYVMSSHKKQKHSLYISLLLFESFTFLFMTSYIQEKFIFCNSIYFYELWCYSWET